MFRAIDRFFFYLTMNNWGFPWHILISWFLMSLLKQWIAPNWTAAGVLMLGLSYEIYQAQQAKNNPVERRQIGKEFLQDMFANMVGVLLGVLL